MKIKNIITNPYLILLVLIRDLVQIIIDIKTSLIKFETMELPILEYDWFDFITKLIIVIILIIVLKEYKKMKIYVDNLGLKIRILDIVMSKNNLMAYKHDLKKEFSEEELKQLGIKID